MTNEHNIFGDNVCEVINFTFMSWGVISVIMAAILFFRRNHAGIATRHPIFSIFHCCLAAFYFFIVLPLSCWIDSAFIIFYLFRVFSIFAWFWGSLCRYQMLYIDNGFLTAMKLAGATPFSANKADYGSAGLYAGMIGGYFMICFIGLVVACVLFEAPFDNFAVNPITQIELVFTVMCIFPFAVIMFWVPHSIWDIRENWKIRDELVYIFMITSILFFWDTAATAFDLFLHLKVVLAVKLIIEAAMLAVTVFMCSIWVIWKVPRDKVVNTSPEKLAEIRDVDTTGGSNQIPLGYVLVREYGYKAFLQHCVDEINVENLQFLAEICYFKKRFLERIEKLHNAQLHNLNQRQSRKFGDDGSLLGQMDEDEDDDDQGISGINHGMNGMNGMNGMGYDIQDLPHRISIPDRMSAQHRRAGQSDKLIWSPCNSLTILTLKMQHGLELMPETNDDDSNNGNSKKKGRRKKKDTNKIAEWHQKYKHKRSKSQQQKMAKINSTSSIEEKLFKNPNEMEIQLSANSGHGSHSDSITEVDDDIPLYVMAYGLYLKFIKEGGDSEINISAKTRQQLHIFFHPRNFAKDDAGGGTAGGPTAGGDTPGGVGLHSHSQTPKGPNGNVTRGGFGQRGKHFNNNNNNNNHTPNGDFEENADNEDLYLYEMLKDRENPNSKHSYTHLYKLYHMFDGAWAEIFHLIVSNVYPRFTSNEKFENIKDELQKDLKDETPFLKTLVNRECHAWFETVKPRSLIIIGVDKLPVDEQISYFGKPLQQVKHGML